MYTFDDELTYRIRPEAFARPDGTVEVLNHYQWNDGAVITDPTGPQAAAGVIGVIGEVYNTSEYHEVMVGETCAI